MRVLLAVLMLFLVPVVTACASPANTPKSLQTGQDSSAPPSTLPPESLQIAQNSAAQPVSVPSKPLLMAQNSAVPTAPLPPPTINGITRASADAGVRTCLRRIEQVSNFITSNTQSKFIMSFPPADVDRQITSASFEVQVPGMGIAYASMTAAPTIGGGCDALYETVSYWTSSCDEVAAKGFSDARPVGVLQQQIMVLQATNNLRIFLMPVGPKECVAIKKELVY